MRASRWMAALAGAAAAGCCLGAAPPGAQPPVAQPTGAQPPVAQPPVAQPPGAQLPGAQPPPATQPAGPDFDADGRTDLAVDTMWQDIGSASAAGEVAVLYGSTGEIGDGESEQWDQSMAGIAGEPDLLGGFGSALETGDFDADGYDDLVLGTQGAKLDYGIVQVLYGSAEGLEVRADQWFTPGRGGLPDHTGQDQMGCSLVAADFDRDGYDDLAMGVRGRAVQAWWQGAVFVLRGGPSGLSTTDHLVFDEDTLAAHPREGEQFGKTLAAGDLDGNGYPELVVGVPDEHHGVGAVFVIPSSAAGLAPADGVKWTERTPGVPGRARQGDSFASAVATGDVDGDGVGDLAVGGAMDSRRRDPDSRTGSVWLFRGSAGSLAPREVTRWTQGSPGVPGRAENGDATGAAVALADLDTDGYDDLAFGSPTEDVRGTRRPARDAGSFNVLYGSGAGLVTGGSQLFSQNSEGVDDVAEHDDHFGSPLAPVDLDNDGRLDLVVGSRWESLDAVRNAGSAYVMHGAPGGLTGVGSDLLHQGTHGVPGEPDGFEYFGTAFGSASGAETAGASPRGRDSADGVPQHPGR